MVVTLQDRSPIDIVELSQWLAFADNFYDLAMVFPVGVRGFGQGLFVLYLLLFQVDLGVWYVR